MDCNQTLKYLLVLRKSYCTRTQSLLQSPQPFNNTKCEHTLLEIEKVAKECLGNKQQ